MLITVQKYKHEETTNMKKLQTEPLCGIKLIEYFLFLLNSNPEVNNRTQKLSYDYARCEFKMTARIMLWKSPPPAYYVCSLLDAAFSFSNCFLIYACFNFSRRAAACSSLRCLSSDAFSLATFASSCTSLKKRNTRVKIMRWLLPGA